MVQHYKVENFLERQVTIISCINQSTCSFMQGIGNSAQGFVDAIIFVVLTQQVRNNMIVCFFQWLRPKRSQLIVNSDVNRSILDKPYQPTRYQAIQPAFNSDDIAGKLAPTTSATTNYSDFPVHNDDDDGCYEK